MFLFYIYCANNILLVRSHRITIYKVLARADMLRGLIKMPLVFPAARVSDAARELCRRRATYWAAKDQSRDPPRDYCPDIYSYLLLD